jgi:chromosome segregation ATPase
MNSNQPDPPGNIPDANDLSAQLTAAQAQCASLQGALRESEEARKALEGANAALKKDQAEMEDICQQYLTASRELSLANARNAALTKAVTRAENEILRVKAAMADILLEGRQQERRWTNEGGFSQGN